MNWLFVKGLARGQVHWDRLPEIFAQAVPEARVFFLDLPGVGEATDRKAPATVAGIVSDLRERFVALRESHEGPWSILAISLGGMIAMEWAMRHPDDFERAVVIVSSATNVSPPWKRLMPETLPGYLRALGTSDLATRERITLGTITNFEEGRERLIEEWLKLTDVCPLPAAATAKQLLAASLWAAPDSLPIPTLFLGTDGDRMVHPSCTPKLAKRFGAPLVMHPDAGHEIPLDDPVWVADQVREWLDGAE